MVYKELDLLDKDNEIEAVKFGPLIDAQIKNLTENPENDAATMEKWSAVLKETFDVCFNRSTEMDQIIDPETRIPVKSFDENLEPLFMIECLNIYNLAVTI